MFSSSNESFPVGKARPKDELPRFAGADHVRLAPNLETDVGWVASHERTIVHMQEGSFPPALSTVSQSGGRYLSILRSALQLCSACLSLLRPPLNLRGALDDRSSNFCAS